MTAARAELRQIVSELQAIKARTLVVARRLKVAARTAEPVVTAADGERVTAERWMADEIHCSISDGLTPEIQFLAAVARSDRRPQIREAVRRDDEHDAGIARGAAAAKLEEEGCHAQG